MRRKYKIASLVTLLLAFSFIIGATTWDGSWSTVSKLWVGDSSHSPTNTLGTNSAYIKNDIEVDGTIYADGGISDTTGGVTSTEIANITRDLVMPGMAGWVVDSSNDIDDATAPNITICDSVPCAIWDNSGETTGILHTFRVPSDYVSGTALVFYCLISSDTASGTSTILDWQVWENVDGSVFDAAAIAQTGATSAETALNTKNDVLTLTLDATGISAITAGDWITLELFNATTHASANIELKGVQGVYTASQ